MLDILFHRMREMAWYNGSDHPEWLPTIREPWQLLEVTSVSPALNVSVQGIVDRKLTS